MNYLQAECLSKSYGDIELFNNITLNINTDSRMALIARNGAGKTSLLNILARKDSPDSGNVIYMPDLEQNPDFDPNLTAFQAVFGSSREIIWVIFDYEQTVDRYKTTSNSKKKCPKN